MNRRRFIEEGWFRDFGEGPTLAGGRCEACGKLSFPVKRVCPACFDERQREVPLSRKGTLHTFAVSHMGPPGIDKPYVIGFVDLPEGIKLFSLLTQCEPWDAVLSIGMEMEMVLEGIGRDGDGNEVVGYKFRPAATEDR